ncbi:hypothetical protein [Pedobacter frigoris]|uniref:Uncharacterized protein n=1 Tax=Pedobacter frigoris TaxID=2571272 RepID=A0A4U1CGM9_9SPHI|nr:hypothetical protein [Pedobacter frigoris]TKC05885.1 hypothetical protein FA047_11110 [Pedobacter frigoris]
MKKLIIVVMACYGLNARAQVDESKNFLYFYSDSVVYANSIKLRPDFYNSWQLRADSRRIPQEQVKFFNNENGFFANTRRQTIIGEGSFSERIVQGKINLFQEIARDAFLYDRGYGYGRHRYGPPVRQSVDPRMYYNKGYTDLKKVNYNNLKHDMADNPVSMNLLEGYRKNMNASKTMYVAAGASIVAGLVSFVVKGSNNARLSDGNSFGHQQGFSSMSTPNFASSFLFLGLGAGLAAGGYAVDRSGYRKLEMAVDAYNR